MNPVENTKMNRFRGWTGSPGFKRYFKNTGWLFSSRVITMGVSFFITAYVVRTLGPASYGYLSYAVSYVSIFSFIASLGIDQVLYRDLIKHPEKSGAYLGTSIALKFIGGGIALAACLATAYVFPSEDVSLVLIAILSLTFLFNPLQTIAYEFQARVESKYPSIISFIVLITLNILKLAAILSGKGVIYLAGILLLESILSGALYVAYRISRYGSMSDFSYDKAIASSLLKDSWPLILGGAFAIIYARVDQIFIKHLIDTTAVGLYDSAVKIVEAWYFIPNIIVSSLFPAIIHAKAVSDREYTLRLRHLSFFLAASTILVALFVTVFAPLILYILYGTEYVAASTVLRVYIWSALSTALGNLAINYLIAENLRKAVFASSLAAMVLNVCLNIYLIPQYGINGAAAATLISYAAVPFTLIFFKEPRTRILKIAGLIKSEA